MSEEKCNIRNIEKFPDGTKLAEVCGVPVRICPGGEHPDKFADARIPHYQEASWPDGCLNCCFRHHDSRIHRLSLACGLTLNDRGYFSGVSPLGKCDLHKKGDSLFP